MAPTESDAGNGASDLASDDFDDGRDDFDDGRDDFDDGSAPASDDSDDGRLTVPLAGEIPRPEEVCAASDATGTVVWHRKHLRTDDQLAVARAVADADVVCPLFVFDPAFYAASGLACDARLRFLDEAVASLDRLYAAVPAPTVARAAADSRRRVADSTPVDPDGTEAGDGPLAGADAPGLTFGYGDPVTLLSRFVDAGWDAVTMATPTSRYGKRRDERVRDACGDAVAFVSGDGLVRGAERPRRNWADRVESWLTGARHDPDWGASGAARLAVETGVTPAAVDEAFGVAPTKRKVPTGTHRTAAERLGSFLDRIRSYPERISAPGAARDGTSGLSPFLNFGLLSVRQVYQAVADRAPSCRGAEMFTDRLVWNLHYNQKLVDWPGWTDTAVNPVFEGRNEDRHDPALVRAWKRGRTGFPMVDASMRCLSGSGWLNFRMRAMCASFFAHVLQQPWWIGADWYHHHLIDSDVGINYTQWQSQAGLVGKPSQRVYNPRKQVRDQDPDGAWITEWVPELEPLPSEFLDRPERTPLPVQEDVGVVVGDDYPRPVVDFEARREAFWSRHERRRPAAADQLARPEIATRASFSGGHAAARAIARKHGSDSDPGPQSVQASLSDPGGVGATADAETGAPAWTSSGPDDGSEGADDNKGSDPPTPTGTGRRAGEPSPDDRAAAGGRDASGADRGAESDADADQTTIDGFGS